MKSTVKLLPMIVLAALTLTACNGTPTSADPETDNAYQAFPELDNTAGADTILGAHSELDGRTVTRSGSAGSAALLLFSGADIVAEVAPYITQTRATRWKNRILGLGQKSAAVVQKSPHMVVQFVKSAAASAPETVERVKTDIAFFRDMRKAKKAKKAEQADVATAAE